VNKFSSLLAAASLVVPLADAHAVDLYVAPSGNDANPGTQDQPFATLERARDVLRVERRAGRHGSPLVVNLRGGVYRMTRTFALAAEDSGTPPRRR